MGESELVMEWNVIYKHDTEMCKQAVQRLRETGLFEEEGLSDPLGGGFCYEIESYGQPFGGVYYVPHNVYWSPNKASTIVGYTGKYIQSLCKTGQAQCYWFGGGYQISVDEIINLRKRYLANKK